MNLDYNNTPGPEYIHKLTGQKFKIKSESGGVAICIGEKSRLIFNEPRLETNVSIVCNENLILLESQTGA